MHRERTSTSCVHLVTTEQKRRSSMCPLSPEQDIYQHIVPLMMLLQRCSSQSQPSRAPAEALGHLKNYPSLVVQHGCDLHNSKLLPNNHI